MKRYKVTLTAVGPVHIGSGRAYSQKEFITGDGWIEVPDPVKLTAFIAEKGKLEEFTRFAERGSDTLKNWLIDHRIMFEEAQLGGYVLDIPEFTQAKPPPPGQKAAAIRLNELKEFVKDPYRLPYVPGSSLKGVLRSLVAKARMSLSPGSIGKDKKGIEVEKQVLRSAGGDATTDLMRAIHVSDSGPLSLSDLTVCQKIDAIPPKENREQFWGLRMFRECLKPGTKVSFAVTVDTSAFDGKEFGLKTSKGIQRRPLAQLFERLNPEKPGTFLEVLAHLSYSAYYSSYLSHFDLFEVPISIPEGELKPGSAFVYLGAGSGFYTKTLWDELEPDNEARQLAVQKVLSRAFRAHKHGNDVRNHGVSPRAVKLTKLSNRFYEMGKCRIAVEAL